MIDYWSTNLIFNKVKTMQYKVSPILQFLLIVFNTNNFKILQETILNKLLTKNNKYDHIISISVSWKVHKLTKILSWNVIKLGLLLNIVLLVVHTLLSSLLHYIELHWSKKSHQQQIWYQLWLFHPTLIYSK